MNWDTAINFITAALSTTLTTPDCRPIKWFLCFGLLLRIVRDKKLPEKDDIDIGIFYDEYDPAPLEQAFSRYQFKIKTRLVNDVTRKPLYYHLYHPQSDTECCVFAWVKHKNLYWHTYDINMENKSRPSKYVFKGMPAEALQGKILRVNVPGTYRMVNIPLNYGTCFDNWYPEWHVKREGQSETRWLIEMDTCAKFKTEKYTKLQSRWHGWKYVFGEPQE